MSDSLQNITTFVRENPIEAAAELQRLRELKAQLIRTLEMGLARLKQPMPQGLDVHKLMGEYAERSGAGSGTIIAALAELKK